MGLKLFSRKTPPPPPPNVEAPELKPKRQVAPVTYEPAPAVPLEDDPLRQAEQLERYGLIAAQRGKWTNHPDSASIMRITQITLDQRYGLVPEGFVSLPTTAQDYPGCPEIDIEVEPFLLARHPITNAQFQKFVDFGAYDELDLWPKDIWPHLIDFKDLTGNPGPRFWRRGRHDRRLADHPVVGVCYYEAMAYAAWAGYRLPTEAEWQMAASWRIRSEAHVLRRYAWGDALDTGRCNIWASGVRNTVPVTTYENGAAPNGVLQLCGNVWEWTASEFDVTDRNGRPIIGDMLMKSVRGGAFDTYFASQATSFFRTGLAALARVHNTGFRCAMDIDGATDA